MSLLLTEMRRSYAAQRQVSQGAAITLVANCSGYEARFECAQRCASVLGERHLIMEGNMPLVFRIPGKDLHRSITKLAESFSVALVDTVTDEGGTRFVLVWKISPAAKAETLATIDLDQY